MEVWLLNNLRLSDYTADSSVFFFAASAFVESPSLSCSVVLFCAFSVLQEVLETQYGAKMKGKRSTMRDREVEERLGDARAERLAHAQHLDNVREAARKSQQK